MIDKKSKPPNKMRAESEQQFSMDENMKLQDQVFHLQSINKELQKNITVKLHAELQQQREEKDKVEYKLKQAQAKVRDHKTEVDRLIAARPTDALARREAQEEWRQKQIDELQMDLA